MTLRVWPNSSNDDQAEQLGPGGDHRHDHVVGQVDAGGVADRGEVPPQRGGQRVRHRRRASQHAVAMGVGDDADDRQRDARRRADRVLRRLVAGHRRAVQQGVLVRVVDRPRRARPGRRRRSARPASAAGRRRRRLLDGRAEGVVGLDDQQRQQLVAAGDVAVHRRRHHAELAGHGAQRQRGGAVGRQLVAPGAHDLRRDLGSRPFRGHPWRSACDQCARSAVTNVSTALAFR